MSIKKSLTKAELIFYRNVKIVGMLNFRDEIIVAFEDGKIYRLWYSRLDNAYKNEEVQIKNIEPQIKIKLP